MSKQLTRPVVKKTIKPLGRKCYGSIGHLPCSRLGPGDHSVEQGQARICTEKARDKHDLIVVQEKVDGSNVGVARLNGELIALNRAGYRAYTSPYEQHRLFADWVRLNEPLFDGLEEGWRVCGEWMALSHGTIYHDLTSPFIAFDLMKDNQRTTYINAWKWAMAYGIEWAKLVRIGGPLSVEEALRILGPGGKYAAEGGPEGLVYRVERDGKVDFLAKYVKPGKVDGCYLPEVSGEGPIWHWSPSQIRRGQ